MLTFTMMDITNTTMKVSMPENIHTFTATKNSPMCITTCPTYIIGTFTHQSLEKIAPAG